MSGRYHDLKTPHGRPARMWAREGTSDLSIINSTFVDDEYGLRDLPTLEGWALDIGAHIGSVAIPLALDNPKLFVIAVEAVPDNCDILEQNVRENGLHGRVIVDRSAISGHRGSEVIWSDFTSGSGLDDDYVATNRYIGNVIRTVNPPEWEATPHTVRASLLSDILVGIHDVAFMKIDCEGCEWFALEDRDIAKVGYIIGEYHDRTEDDLAAMLLPTHEVTTYPAGDAIGLFRAERRK